MQAVLETRRWFPRCRLTVIDSKGRIVLTETFWSVKKAREAVDLITLYIWTMESHHG